MTSKIHIEHIGLEFDYHHEASHALRLAEEVEDAYSLEKEVAPIFMARPSGRRVGVGALLDAYFRRKHATVANFIPEKAMVPGKRYVLVFPLSFPAGMLAVKTTDGPVDVKRIKVAIEAWIDRPPPEKALAEKVPEPAEITSETGPETAGETGPETAGETGPETAGEPERRPPAG